MIWSELKHKIRDLGFEENGTMTEYTDKVINAVNIAQNWIYRTVVEGNSTYFLTTGKKKRLIPPSQIETTTEDTFEIELPEKVIDLLPLMASYFVWLDDDERKAVMYWNNADDLRMQLEADMKAPREFVFNGGVSL